jgi:3-methyl-2-oxobutanoate hydroxymethyltransferase
MKPLRKIITPIRFSANQIKDNIMNIFDFSRYKEKGEKISMVTCYDATTATLLSDTPVDCLLVGDSLAMTIYGYTDTLKATIPLMVAHTEAVRRGNHCAFIVTDLPFLSYRKGKAYALDAAGKLISSGASAVKLEGGDPEVLETVKALIPAGIPVMGHLGLTPQSLKSLGGYRVQGKEDSSAQKIKEEAWNLQEVGCFSLVLECVPQSLAREISQELTIPVIGIGAGRDVDGQVLVIQDLLGQTKGHIPKFVRPFGEGDKFLREAINKYCNEVKRGNFPSQKESYCS